MSAPCRTQGLMLLPSPPSAEPMGLVMLRPRASHWHILGNAGVILGAWGALFGCSISHRRAHCLSDMGHSQSVASCPQTGLWLGIVTLGFECSP